jgi:hypothetical protein
MGAGLRLTRRVIRAELCARSPEFLALAGGGVRLERLSRGLGIVSEVHPDPALSVLGFDARSTPRPTEVGGSSEHAGPPAAVGLSPQGLGSDSLQADSMGFNESPAQASTRKPIGQSTASGQSSLACLTASSEPTTSASSNGRGWRRFGHRLVPRG